MFEFEELNPDKVKEKDKRREDILVLARKIRGEKISWCWRVSCSLQELGKRMSWRWI